MTVRRGMIDRKVSAMPGAERMRWRVHNRKQTLYAAPDHERERVLVQCSAGMRLTKNKAMELANILVDVAEQLPD